MLNKPLSILAIGMALAVASVAAADAKCILSLAD